MSLGNWINANGKSIIMIVGFACATEIAWRLYKKYGSSKKNQSNIHLSKPISEVFFFSEQGSACRSHSNNDPCSMASCPVLHLNKIEDYISSTTRTLDVCVYFLTSAQIVKRILELQRRNVIIRVITDDEASSNDSCQILYMRRAGIQVRSRKSLYLMHHKFVIIDKRILITGSANWTLQAFFGNCENMIITNQNEIVNAFNTEFEKLWLKFSGEYPQVQNGISTNV